MDEPIPDENVPPDVTDIMLWRLASQVAESHRPDPNDPTRCSNLRCARETYPCEAARSAEYALRASRARPQAPEAEPAPAGEAPTPMATTSQPRVDLDATSGWSAGRRRSRSAA
ncbi:MAG TPA: hypothetical protein VIL44_10460 [Micromonospora sp.]